MNGSLGNDHLHQRVKQQAHVYSHSEDSTERSRVHSPERSERPLPVACYAHSEVKVRHKLSPELEADCIQNAFVGNYCE